MRHVLRAAGVVGVAAAVKKRRTENRETERQSEQAADDYADDSASEYAAVAGGGGCNCADAAGPAGQHFCFRFLYQPGLSSSPRWGCKSCKAGMMRNQQQLWWCAQQGSCLQLMRLQLRPPTPGRLSMHSGLHSSSHQGGGKTITPEGCKDTAEGRLQHSQGPPGDGCVSGWYLHTRRHQRIRLVGDSTCAPSCIMHICSCNIQNQDVAASTQRAAPFPRVARQASSARCCSSSATTLQSERDNTDTGGRTAKGDRCAYFALTDAVPLAPLPSRYACTFGCRIAASSCSGDSNNLSSGIVEGER